jgi:hypothetical protein
MFKLSRLVIVYAIAAPLALILGLLVVWPGLFPVEVIGAVVLFLVLPIFLQWHHILLIVFWNTVLNARFLPGQPDFWLVMAIFSFTISFLTHIIAGKRFLRAPAMTRPLLFLGAVVLGTAWFRGGIGLAALGGSTFGGRYYVFLIGAILGYFAFTSEAIPLAKAQKMSSLFFLSGSTNVLSNLIYMAGPFFFILYLVVPTGNALSQYYAEGSSTEMARIGGMGMASFFVMCFLFMRFGLRGLFDWSKPWRFIAMFLSVAACGLSGFRSSMLSLILLFVIQFYLEGLFRTRMLPIVVAVAIASFIPVLFFAKSMPEPVQRAISFLPIEVSSDVLSGAKSSEQWRFDMWEEVSKMVPRYLLIGKGYSIDRDEIFALTEAGRVGAVVNSYEGSMLAGDYHSGPLSVIIPFGLPGVIGFLWVLVSGYRVLSRNYRFGDVQLRRINRLLLSCFLTRCFCFFFIFGALSTELCVFTGLCGFSVCLNGGIRRRAAPKPMPAPVTRALAMDPG